MKEYHSPTMHEVDTRSWRGGNLVRAGSEDRGHDVRDIGLQAGDLVLSVRDGTVIDELGHTRQGAIERGIGVGFIMSSLVILGNPVMASLIGASSAS